MRALLKDLTHRPVASQLPVELDPGHSGYCGCWQTCQAGPPGECAPAGEGRRGTLNVDLGKKIHSGGPTPKPVYGI